MKLGPFTVEHPFLLAPMAGITNSPFRRIMKRYRSTVVISELVSANGLAYGNSRTSDLLSFHEEERPVGLQIFGEVDEHLVSACKYVENLKADFVDLNLGCPVPKIVRKGAGSAMCRNPARLYETLAKMVESVRIPVTIKIRLGWDDSSINALEVVQAAHRAGVAWVAIHGRTREQGYAGHADWKTIAEIKAQSPLPIIGNGDVVTPEQAVQIYGETKVDGVMIGRGALKNPFIFEQSESLLKKGLYLKSSIKDYLKFLHEQRDLLASEKNQHSSLVQSKKFLSWYSAGYTGSSDFRKMIFASDNFQDVWNKGLDFFSRGFAPRDESHLQEGFLMGGHG